MKNMKKLFSKIARGEEGVTLLVVLIMMTLGSVLVIPTLNFAATSIETGEVFEEKMEALYAAEAGVEDALWKMINAIPDNFPHSYELTDINGMTVDVVIDKITTIAGVEIGDFGVHADWLIIDKSITYDEGEQVGSLVQPDKDARHGQGRRQERFPWRDVQQPDT